MTSYWLEVLPLLLILERVSHGLAQGCYFIYSNDINNPFEASGVQLCNSVPNQYMACCIGGDSCMTNLICHFTHLLNGSSGYYVAGCTDPTFKDTSACSTHCTDAPTQDIVYNSETQLWACCNTPQRGLDCSQPGDETFFAPSPEQLFSLASSITSTASSAPSSVVLPSSSPMSSTTALSTGSTSLLATTTSMATATATSPPTPTPAPSGLTTGTQAGIGIGAGLVVLAIVVGAFFWIRWSRRPKIVPIGNSTGPWSAGVAENNALEVEAYHRPESDAREIAQLPALYNHKGQELP